MKLTSVHHIAVINSNYEKSYDFYVNRLGLKVIFDKFNEMKKDGEAQPALETENKDE